MKLAVLSDIHGNFVALQTVAAHIEQWKPDLVVVAGDVVNRGPRPLECLQFVQQKQQQEGWLVVRGNHEDYVIQFDDPGTNCSGLEFEIFRGAYWTYQQLGGDVSTLKAMPLQVTLNSPNDDKIYVVHASVHHNRDGVFPKNTVEQIRQKFQAPDISPPAVFCTAHTHWPLIKSVDDTLVVNVGTAGLPFDGDYRVSYAQLIWLHGRPQAKIIRLDYERQQAEKDFFESGYLEQGGVLIRLILDELRIARPHLFKWTYQYQQAILDGKIGIAEAVEKYLNERGKHDKQSFAF